MVVPFNVPYHGQLHSQRQTTSLLLCDRSESAHSVILRPAYFSHFLPKAPCRYTENNTFLPHPSPTRSLSLASSLLKSDSLKNRKIKRVGEGGGESHFLIAKASGLVAGILIQFY